MSDEAFDIGVLTAKLDATCAEVSKLTTAVTALTDTTNEMKNTLAAYSIAGRLLRKTVLVVAGVWIALKTGDIAALKALFAG